MSSKKHSTRRYDLSSDLEKIKDAFTDTAHNVKGKASQVFSESLGEVKDKSTHMKDNVETYLSERPFKTLFVAMLSGMFLGSIMRKKKYTARYRE